MGSCSSSTASIDANLSKPQTMMFPVKILLLGPGDSGKSTFLKQLKAIHFQDLPFVEKARFTSYIKENLLLGMKNLIPHLQHENSSFDPEENPLPLTLVKNSLEPSHKVLQAIHEIWSIPHVQQLYYQSLTKDSDSDANLHHFLNLIPTILSDDYLPNLQDILLTRAKTTGICETTFDVSDQGYSSRITVIDVGGEKSERRKWPYHFPGTDFVIFFFPLDNYFVIGDSKKTKFQDTLELFESLMTQDDLSLKNWIVFLNKQDLFQQALDDHPLDKYFKKVSPTQGSNVEFALQYFQNQISKRFRGQNLNFFVTNALDTKQMEKVFSEAYQLCIKNFTQTQQAEVVQESDKVQKSL